MKENSLLELLLEERMTGALEKVLSTDVGYQNTCKKINKRVKRLDKTKLNEKQSSAVDRVLTAQNVNSSEYGRAAYRQGFKDGLLLLQEIDRLKYMI